MRDGVEIAVDVVLPDGEGPFPTVVTRTPYMRVHLLGPHGWAHLLDHGYAYVAVDVRGRGDSDGSFMPFRHDADDAYDTIEWIADQPWCSGRIGMVGSSYEALTQWWTAKSKPPHLACIAPMAVGAASLGPRPRAGTGVPQTYFLMLLHRLSGRTLQYIYSPNWSQAIGTLPMRDMAAKLGVDEKLWNAYVDGEIDYLSGRFRLTDADWAQLTIPVLRHGRMVRTTEHDGYLGEGRAIAGRPAVAVADRSLGPRRQHPAPSVRRWRRRVRHIIDPLQPLRAFLARHLKGEVGDPGPSRCPAVFPHGPHAMGRPRRVAGRPRHADRVAPGRGRTRRVERRASGPRGPRRTASHRHIATSRSGRRRPVRDGPVGRPGSRPAFPLPQAGPSGLRHRAADG